MFPRQANPGPPSKGWLVCSIRKERKKSKRQALPPVPRHGLVSEPGFPCGLSAYGEGSTGYLFVLSCCCVPLGRCPATHQATFMATRSIQAQRLLETELHPPNLTPAPRGLGRGD